MKAHIVGGGFGGLAAAALLIRNAEAPGQDITIYEADDKLGGGFFLCGDAKTGYNLPGSVFDKEFRCAFDLLATIPTEAHPNISVKEQFFTFNEEYPFVDQTHIVDRALRPVHGPRFGLSLSDGFALAKLSLTPELRLDGRRIKDFFSAHFFETEFWLLWSTIMGSLPQHSLIEFRRYINRFVYLFPDLSTMAHVLRSPANQNEAFVKPLVAWLTDARVNFMTGAFVQDIGFASSPGLTVNLLKYEREGAVTPVPIAPDDIVLVTTGSQAADLSAGSMTAAPPPPPHPGRSWALWERLAAAHEGFGNPAAFFGPDRIADSRWVTLTVTTTGKEFFDEITGLTRSDPGSGGLLTLKDFRMAAVAVDLPPAGNPRPAAGRVGLVGLRALSRARRDFREEAHGSMHGRGDPEGVAAAPWVPDIGRDHEVVDLHSVQHALREQHLVAAQAWRQAPRGSGGGDQSRAHRPVRRT